MYTLYRFISIVLTPFYLLLALYRLCIGKEEFGRLSERFGLELREKNNTHKNLIWVHCASVGESISILPLLQTIHDDHPELTFLVTSYTKTAANIMKRQNLPYVTHRYIPYDHPLFVYLFLKRWTPKAVFWVESEFWPETLRQIKTRNIPAFLINARLSKRSFQKWQKFAPKTIASLLSGFCYIHAQTAEYADALSALTQKPVQRVSNLKTAAPPLSYDMEELDVLKIAWQDRVIVMFASTHKGEEDIALGIYDVLKKQYPSLLMIIAPRHPERGSAINALCQQKGVHNTIQRSHGHNDADLKEVDLYIADSLGELGLFYALSPIVVIGNSFIHIPGGGHNPLEPAHHGCMIVYGPSMYNFDEIDRDMREADCVKQVATNQELEEAIDHAIRSPSERDLYAAKAYQFVQKGHNIPDQIWTDIKSHLLFLSNGVHP